MAHLRLAAFRLNLAESGRAGLGRTAVESCHLRVTASVERWRKLLGGDSGNAHFEQRYSKRFDPRSKGPIFLQPKLAR